MKKEQTIEYVYVISMSGKPLMPTKRLGFVRHLLKSKQAKIVGYDPFTIQLLKESKEYVQELNLGCDPGYEHSAFSVTSKFTEFFSEEFLHTSDMTKLLKMRNKYRGNRR
jgi:hypothetical protein